MPSSGGNGPSPASGVSHSEALQRMYRITSDYERTFEEKLNDLLDLGRQYLGVEAGFLTEISGDTQRIVHSKGDHELLQPGKSCPLSRAYCRKTVLQQAALTVQHASVEGWEQDTAYEAFGLESYVGAKVIVDGDLYGTFCFADKEPRDEPFSADEETFVELMSSWVSYELRNRRASERIEQQREQLDRFASVVSHDLRNPLSIAQGRLELAQAECDSEHLEDVAQAHTRIETLIDDLLALARAGEQVGDTETVAIADVVRASCDTVATGRATVVTDIDRTIRADRSRLRQLFANLVRNAVEHGGEDVSITVGELDDGFSVEDDGPGIPEDSRDEVFEAGYSTAEDGIGFGLNIVKQIVDAHGWTIDVTEGTDGGARFEIRGVEFTE